MKDKRGRMSDEMYEHDGRMEQKLHDNGGCV